RLGDGLAARGEHADVVVAVVRDLVAAAVGGAAVDLPLLVCPRTLQPMLTISRFLSLRLTCA
ncbi:MAG: hypothetical protein NT044_02940, partial [Micrococcales bacterium]|nr:hypothetical protein [Micrococcales bacterium]